jgi:hypothetical protein
MIGIHKCANGSQMNISEMDDTHLKNTIAFILKRIQAAKELLRDSTKKDSFSEALRTSPIKHFNKGELKNVVQDDTKNICLYVAEAQLRGISVTEALQTVFERKERIAPMQDQTAFLLGQDVEEMPVFTIDER